MPRATIRLCERCWFPIPADTAYLVHQHVDRSRPQLPPSISYRHLAGDSACTGSQMAGSSPITGSVS